MNVKLIMLSLFGVALSHQAVYALNLSEATAIYQDEFSVRAINDEYSLPKLDFTVSGNVLNNDSGATSAYLKSSANGNYGSISLSSDGSFVYTLYPDLEAIKNLSDNETLTETFSYKMIGINYYESGATLTIRIIGNSAGGTFYALNDEVSVKVSTTTDDGTELLSNFDPDDYTLYDEDGEPITIIIEHETISGNVTSNDLGFKTAELISSGVTDYGVLEFDSSGAFQYSLKPTTADWNKINTINEVFTYRIYNEYGYSADATLTIRLLGGAGILKAEDDLVSLYENTGSVSGNVSLNDTGYKSKTVSLTSSGSSSYGTLSLDSQGNFTYTISDSVDLAYGQKLEDVYSYSITNENGSSDTASIIISIWSSEDPVATAPSSSIFSALDDVNIVFPYSANGPNGTTTITGNLIENDKGVSSSKLISNPLSNYGSLAYDPNTGSYTYTLFEEVSEIANMGLTDSFTDSFVYEIADANGFTDQGTLIITILPNPLGSFQALDDENSIIVRTTEAVEGNVTTNDTGYKTAKLISSGSSSYGILTFDDTGAYSYLVRSEIDLASGQSVDDSFTYQISDGKGRVDQAVLTIHVLGKNPEASTFKAINDYNTVIKNSANEADGSSSVSGSLTDNDVVEGEFSSNLISSPIGNYGSLVYDSANDSYKYTLFDNVKAIQDLETQQSLTETFTYQIINVNDDTSQATLTITILGDSPVTTNTDEIEPNDRTNSSGHLATSINGVSKDIRQFVRGHLQEPDDKDWFSIQSLGDETISVELCPTDATCYSNTPPNAWVLYIFDGDQLTTAQETATYGLDQIGETTGTNYGQWSSSNHLYANYVAGVFDSSLIGIVDPCYGTNNKLSITVPELTAPATTKTYFIAISSPLKREGDGCAGGSIIQKDLAGSQQVYVDANGANQTEDTYLEHFTVYPNSDDQYIFSIVRTGSPVAASADAIPVTFNAETRVLKVPRVRVNAELYSADLTQLNGSIDNAYDFGITKLEKLEEELTHDASTAIYNPENNIVRIPNYLDEETNQYYYLILLYHPAQGDQQQWLEFIYADLIQ